MKEAFKDWKPTEKSRMRVQDCNQIIHSYQAQGYRLTLRQLYYQLVSRNIIANTEKEYKALGGLLNRARLAGLVDWAAIEDRGRRPHTPLEYEGLQEMMDDALLTYRLPRWEGQDVYAELWVEKDALAGVLQPLASHYHTTLMVNRGYSSQSAMYTSAGRIAWNKERLGCKEAIVLYLGDLDPSGEDMVRDIRDRLHLFGAGCDVYKLALTEAQVRTHNPPPNPTKLTDSRASGYVAKFGMSSWEVDALPPNLLEQYVTAAFDELLDERLIEAVLVKEERDKQDVRNAVRQLLKKRKSDG